MARPLAEELSRDGEQFKFGASKPAAPWSSQPVMGLILTDTEIERLITLRKPLPKGWRRRLQLRRRRSEAQTRCQLSAPADGNDFVIKCRQSTENPLDFSVILVWRDNSGNEYRLLRCNGPHPSDHTNRWEKVQGKTDHTFGPCFHIHKATQRYQEAGLKIDGYAQPTDSYSDCHAALLHLVGACGFIDPEPPGDSHPRLFGDME